ncbi:MAG: hypothetical protein IT544_00495 [Rhodobacteraceae bacterium]|jgi:hypothetical protein|nr:hypothetical protein [Paracoccaceae bacterium]
MSSIVFICNLALSNIGKSNISDIDEASAEARTCKQFYTHTRDMLLQSHPWRWAGKVDALAEIKNHKANRWDYAYQRPSDCLNIRRVLNQMLQDYVPYEARSVKAGGFNYALEGSIIYCNQSPAYLEYTMRADDPALFPPLFLDALAWHLAVRLAMPLTRDPKIRTDAYQLAVQISGQAAAADANEMRDASDFPAEMMEARRPKGQNDRTE